MGKIRIISGKYRGKALFAPEGEETRPLLSRLRKSLADILRPRLQGTFVLDLFAGSGAIGFELLSNGAQKAVLIEKSPRSASYIRQNALALGAEAKVIESDCLKVIPSLFKAGEKFDVILVAPPYGLELQRAAMEALAENPLLAVGGTVVVQREAKESFWEPVKPFHLIETRKYGRTVFDFYGSDG
ncbi:16S rRNA (guanine(966)-N(2))-methyltransferase RsmD [bacterium]|nr:MAG: 16S rRNA (guanine(966)-N(2))-methyltransferase RsmD [bacterium]